jgi:hypothetical protein
MSELRSGLYLGRLTHARFAPRPHAFGYRLYMLYLDLDELDGLRLGPLFGVERARPLSFRRRDYLGDAARPLRDEVLDEVERATGTRPDGAVRLLTHVRSWGYVFNPVTFYYCFDAGGRLAAVVSEITNTPWGERHSYVTPATGGEARNSFDKRFHVSPFFPMSQRYHWSFSDPAERLSVDMENEQDGRPVFRAKLVMRRLPLTATRLTWAAIAQPLMAWKVHAAIYWQALRLLLKRTPTFAHPGAHATPARRN